MKISNIEIRMCRHAQSLMKDTEMRDGKKSDLEFLVITFETDEGLSSSTFGFAGRGAEMAGEIANSIFKRKFMYKVLWGNYGKVDSRILDRNFSPIYFFCVNNLGFDYSPISKSET